MRARSSGARTGGVGLQVVRDWVLRFNAGGPDALKTRKAPGKTILCVYVPTTPIPTSGYMLMLPEDDVTELSWSLDETLQAIVSGGITVPEKVDYFPAK